MSNITLFSSSMRVTILFKASRNDIIDLSNTFYFHGGDVLLRFVKTCDITTAAVEILYLTEDRYNHKNKMSFNQQMLFIIILN